MILKDLPLHYMAGGPQVVIMLILDAATHLTMALSMVVMASTLLNHDNFIMRKSQFAMCSFTESTVVFITFRSPFCLFMILAPSLVSSKDCSIGLSFTTCAFSSYSVTVL